MANVYQNLCGVQTGETIHVEVVDGPDNHTQRFRPFCIRPRGHPPDEHKYVISWPVKE